MNRECTQRGYTEQRDDSRSGGMGQDGGRFHHDIQNSTPFKTYELGYLWKVPFNVSGPQFTTGTWTAGSETPGKRGALYLPWSVIIVKKDIRRCTRLSTCTKNLLWIYIYPHPYLTSAFQTHTFKIYLTHQFLYPLGIINISGPKMAALLKNFPISVKSDFFFLTVYASKIDAASIHFFFHSWYITPSPPLILFSTTVNCS